MSTPRQLAVAMASGVAAAFAGRFQRDLTREAALERLAEISADPAIFAEAAAQYVAPTAGPDLPWHPEAVRLLVDAGADPEAIERYALERRSRKPGGFSLGTFAEGINALDSAHGPSGPAVHRHDPT